MFSNAPSVSSRALKLMLPAIVLVAALCAAANADQTQTTTKLGLSDELCSAGWIALFDGHSLFGWQPTSDANWRVAGGSITVSEGEAGFLNTTTRFADFELSVEYRAPIETNSGIFVRSVKQPTDPAKDCYEINIAPTSHPFASGSIVKRNKTSKTLSLAAAEWHTIRIMATGANLKVWFDGHLSSDYTDSDPRTRGHIGLQFRGGQIAFRNIRIRPLGLKEIFNGSDLTGWNDEKADASRFFVEDGVLRVLNGRGQLETDDSFADFVLQLECKTHAAGLNSGIFFRCIPGDQMMGYESQIQNAYQNDDRSQPADCGTGGIFRRQNARTIVADDLNWFHKTIIAEGAHIATWVNGHQVVDWTDDREPHENPRKGLRTQSGTIMIQGHDPTTDLSFRNFRIAELPTE